MLPSERQRAMQLLHLVRTDVRFARAVEARCHAPSTTRAEYHAHVRRATFNLRNNPAIGDEVTTIDDEALARGTLMEKIVRARQERDERFCKMLQEKYDELNSHGQGQSILRCRKCRGTDIHWDEKQTRGADEAATVFCVCTTCHNRWVIR